MNRKERRKIERMKDKMQNKPTLQKISNVQALDQDPQQRPPTPEEVLNFVARRAKEIEEQARNQEQQFVQHYFNIGLNTAIQLFQTAYSRMDLLSVSPEKEKEIIDMILDLSFSFSDEVRKRSSELQTNISKEFKIPESLVEILVILEDKKRAAEEEIVERNKLQEAAKEEIQKLQEEKARESQKLSDEKVKDPESENKEERIIN